MNKPMASIACLVTLLSLAAAAPAADKGADNKKMTEVDRILDRALSQMAGTEDVYVESDMTTVATKLEDGSQLTTWHRYRIASRAPSLFWSETLSSTGGSYVKWSDGKVMRGYGVSAGASKDDAERKISERPLLEGDYSGVGGHKFSMTSAFDEAAGKINRALGMTSNAVEQRRYLGRQDYRGESCDVIEMTNSMHEETWAKTRAQYPQAPEKGPIIFKLYLRASDGRLMRAEDTEWSATEVKKPGEEKGEWIFNLRNDRTTEFRYGPAPEAAAFDAARFDAAVRGMVGLKGKMPEIERPVDEWKGKSMPDIQLVALNGKPVKWSDFKGKVLVVETWFIGCGYCKNAFPYYDKMRAELKGKGVEFMAFNVGDAKDNSAKHIRDWQKKSKDKFDFLWTLSSEPAKDVRKKLKSDGAPHFFVVDSSGTVVTSYGGFGYGDGGNDPRLIQALNEAGVKL